MTDFPDVAEAPIEDTIVSVRAEPLTHCSTTVVGVPHSARCFIGDCDALRALQHFSKPSNVSDVSSIVEYAMRGDEES